MTEPNESRGIYNCPICGRKCRKKGGLTAHIKRTHCPSTTDILGILLHDVENRIERTKQELSNLQALRK